jgi:hypothetical protein
VLLEQTNGEYNKLGINTNSFQCLNVGAPDASGIHGKKPTRCTNATQHKLGMGVLMAPAVGPAADDGRLLNPPDKSTG